MKKFIDMLKEEKVKFKQWGELSSDERLKVIEFMRKKKLFTGTALTDTKAREFKFAFQGEKLMTVDKKE